MQTYEQGYLSIDNGSNIAKGTGTQWLNYVKPGDTLVINAVDYVIESIEDHNLMTLSTNFIGVTISNSVYLVERQDYQQTKQYAFDKRLREFQDVIYRMQRQPILSMSDDGVTLRLFFATDTFRFKLQNPESFGIDAMGGVRFWGADGYDYAVGIGWFDIYNPMINILSRDKLLDTQLYDARAAIKTMLNDTAYSAEDILNYDPGFTMPT